MDGELVGLAAVVMSLGIPIAAMYTYYRVRKLRTDERLAALARGVDVPMERADVPGPLVSPWPCPFDGFASSILVRLQS